MPAGSVKRKAEKIFYKIIKKVLTNEIRYAIMVSQKRASIYRTTGLQEVNGWRETPDWCQDIHSIMFKYNPEALMAIGFSASGKGVLKKVPVPGTFFRG